MNPDKIGKFLKEKRQSINLSQQELGDKIHVTRQAISGWENGKSCPDSDLLLTLSELFNVSINEILSGGSIDTNIEKVALDLVDENIKKSTKLKRQLITFISIIIILLFCFLGYYFINNYNSIKVYKVAGKSNIFRIRDGLLVKTQNDIYLKLGDIYSNSSDNKIDYYLIYYKNKDNKKVIIKTTDHDINYSFKKSYKNYFNNSSIMNNLYLEIHYNNNKKEVIYLKLREQYNNKLNIFTSPPETQKKMIKSDNKLFSDIKNILLKGNKNKEKEEVKREEIQEIKPSLETNNNEEINNSIIQEEETKDIDYEEIIRIVQEKGVLESNIYRMDLMLDDKYISISTINNQIVIDVMYGNIMEQWVNNIIDTNDFTYTKMENFIDAEQFTVNLNNMNNNQAIKLEEMNSYLLMIYQ